MTIRSHVKRFRILIYPEFQLTLLLGNLVVSSSIFYFVYKGVKDAFLKLEQDGVIQGFRPNHPYFEFIQTQSETILHGIFVTFAIGVLTSSIWMLLISNKLSGPILRLRSFFTQIADGDKNYPEVAFRKGDFFTELPPVINKALKELRESKG